MNDIFTRLYNSLTVRGAVLHPVIQVVTLAEAEEEPHPKAAALIPNDAYFSMSLCEMHLCDDQAWGVNYAPCAVAVSEFAYGDSRLKLPIVVGTDLLHEFADLVTNKRINFSNTPLVGPMPYRGGDLAFFLGLYGIKTGDAVKDALSMISSLATATKADLKGYLDVAGCLSNGVSQLLNRSDRVAKLGERQVFNSDMTAALTDRYIILINEQKTKVERDRLVVRDQRLCRRTGDGALEPYLQHDYCLLKIFFRSSRGDYSQLPFYGRVEEARQQTLDGQSKRAKWTLIDAMKAIDASPDLIDSQKTDLMTICQTRFDQLEARNGSTEEGRGFRGGTGSGPDRTGGGSGGSHDAKCTMQRIARHAKADPIGRMVGGMSNNWDAVRQVLAVDDARQPVDAALETQLEELNGLSYPRVPPGEFLKALETDALLR